MILLANPNNAKKKVYTKEEKITDRINCCTVVLTYSERINCNSERYLTLRMVQKKAKWNRKREHNIIQINRQSQDK